MNTNTLNIKCELTIDDAIAWNYYYLENSAQWKKNWKLIRFLFMPIMAICFILGIIYLIRGIDRSIASTMVGGGIGIIIGGGGVLYYVLYPNMLRRKVRKTAKIVYGCGENSLIGKHSFTVSPEGVTDNENAIVKWTAVEGIAQTSEHIFILVLPNKAFIIPKRAFTDKAAVNRFVQDTKDILQSAQKAT